MINRRNFGLGLLASLAAPALVRVESLMPLRATPQIIPVADIITADILYHAHGGNLLTVEMITRETMRLFIINNSDFAYDAEFARMGNKVGQSLRIKTLPKEWPHA